MIKTFLSLFKKQSTPTVAWESYCKKNPSAPCCRIYDV